MPSDYDVLMILKKKSAACGVDLSVTECAFFISLARYLADHGTYDETTKLHCIQLSVREMSSFFDYSPGFIGSALRNLEECQLIRRERPVFSKSSNARSFVTGIDLRSLGLC